MKWVCVLVGWWLQALFLIPLSTRSKRPLVHEVFAKEGSLLALDALLHLTRFGGVGNHADGVVVAHVFPQPVEQHHHLVFHAENGAQVHHEPQYPGKEALARVFHSF